MPSSVDIGDVSSQSTADLGFDVADSSSTLDLVPSTFTFVDESGGGADETAGSSTSQFIDVVVRPITLSPNLLDAAPTITFDTTLPLSTLSLRAILGPTGGATPAPEPGTLMLVGSGLIAAIRRRRRVRSGLAVLR
jgi:hypothetical protein